MGFRFRRRIRLLPGIAINLSKTGASLSVGRRGATMNFGPRGTRTTIGLPGTGISYSTLHSSRSGRGAEAKARAQFTQARQAFERAAAWFPPIKEKCKELIALAGPERGARLQHMLDEITGVIDETRGDIDSVLGLPRLISKQAVTLAAKVPNDTDRLQRLGAMASKEALRLAELLDPGCTAGVKEESDTAGAEEEGGAVERPKRNTTATVVLAVLLALGALGALQALPHRKTSGAPTLQSAPISPPASGSLTWSFGPGPRVYVNTPEPAIPDVFADPKFSLVPLGR
jgi:hypothetical protein